MKTQKIINLVKLPRFTNEEQNRTAGILYFILFTTLIGLMIMMTFRIVTKQYRTLPSLGAMMFIAILSLMFLRRGRLKLSSSLFLWIVLILLEQLMWGYYGIHDMAILAFPAVIVIAALTLDKKYFILFSLTSLFTIGLEGYLEIIGILKFSNYPETTSVTLTNTLVILSITAVVVRLISSNFNKSLVAARNAEKEIRSQFDQLQVWNKRYRSLFEVANDAIFIMDEGRFVECNSRALGMFGCDNRSEIVGHSPWDFSPARQPGGGDSEREARNLIQAALSGKPQRFYWKHIQKDGTPFDAEVSLSAIDLSNKYLQVLVRDISERRQGELLQNAIYMISQAADKSANLNDLYKAVHEIVGTVMPASNFYIALYDERADIVSFPYFVDEIDSFCSPHKFGKGLTEYVIRTGKSFLCDEAADKELTARGEIELIGPPSVVWIGVPLVVDYKTIGVMVAQHYTNTKAYGERETQDARVRLRASRKGNRTKTKRGSA